MSASLLQRSSKLVASATVLGSRLHIGIKESADFNESIHQDSNMSKRKGPSEDNANQSIMDFLMGKP